MTKPLKRHKNSCWHFVDGKRIEGVHDKLTGDVSGLTGDVTWMYGNASDIPTEERALKPNISDWVEEEGNSIKPVQGD